VAEFTEATFSYYIYFMMIIGVKQLLRLLPLYVKSLVKRDKKNDGLSSFDIIENKNFAIDIDHLNSYKELCGFVNRNEEVPATYMHLPAFDMQLSLLTHKDFPYASMGMVHLNNSIKVYKAIEATDMLDYSTQFLPQYKHARGVVVPVQTTIKRGGELVWEEVSDFLKINKKSTRENKVEQPEEVENQEELLWFFPEGLGRQYAWLSGDINPIHLYNISARMFGFKKALVHGMFTKARALAALEELIPNTPYQIQVSFKSPLYLPQKVSLRHFKNEAGIIHFQVLNIDDKRPFLEGVIFRI
jgi:hypothetical protein